MFILLMMSFKLIFHKIEILLLTFKLLKKRQKDISEVDQKTINMYVCGLTTRQIAEQIEDIYDFECYENFISNVTD